MSEKVFEFLISTSKSFLLYTYQSFIKKKYGLPKRQKIVNKENNFSFLNSSFPEKKKYESWTLHNQLRMCMCLNMCVQAHVYVFVYMYIRLYVYEYVCICVHVCVCVRERARSYFMTFQHK